MWHLCTREQKPQLVVNKCKCCDDTEGHCCLVSNALSFGISVEEHLEHKQAITHASTEKFNSLSFCKAFSEYSVNLFLHGHVSMKISSQLEVVL